STSRPTTSTSTPSPRSKPACGPMTAPCSSSATTALSSRPSASRERLRSNENGPRHARAVKSFAARSRSLVPVHLLAPLVHFLSFEAERRDRAGIEPRDGDRIARFLAKPVGAVLDALQRRVDLADQLALAVAGPQLQRAVAFRRRAIGHVRMVLAFFLEILERLAALAKDVVLPVLELPAEVVPLPRVHERLVFRRP